MTCQASCSVACREALVKWLSEQSWTFFATFSFRLPITGCTSLRHLRRLLWHIANATKGEVRAFAGVEWFRSKEGRHIHALIATAQPDATWLAWHKWWFKHYGIDRWEPYDPERGAGYYVTKYILKEDRDAATWDYFTEQPKEGIDWTMQLFGRKKA